MPSSIPGKPLYSPDPPGKRTCPRCKRSFQRARVKSDNMGQKILLCCPYCGYKLSPKDD